MKKIVLSLLSFSLILSLCACQTVDDKSKEPEKPTETEIEIPYSEDKVIIKGDFLDEYSDPMYDGLDINKFLGTAIMNVRPEEMRVSNIPIISKNSPRAEVVFNLVHLSPEDLENYAIAASEDVTRAYTVAIVKAKPFCEEKIMSGLQLRIDEVYKQVQDYPDQIYISENMQTAQVGDFLVVVICDNADKVIKEFIKVLENTDLTTINSIPFYTEEERIEIENEILNRTKSEFEEQEKDEVGEVEITPVEIPEEIEEIVNSDEKSIDEN